VSAPLSALAASARSHVDALCGLGPDRHPGTQRNRAATDYVAERLRALGDVVEELGFDVPEWLYGDATLRVGDVRVAAHPGPFSPPVDGAGPLVEVSSAEQLGELSARGAILLLHGDIAKAQFTPREYPWYSDSAHEAILDALEALEPLAIVAATGKNPATTAGLSPFPLIDDPGFTVPSAYITAEQGELLRAHAGERATLRIDSRTVPSTGTQLIGRLPGSGSGRVIVGAHVDTKPDTPGALDNAAGVATMLVVAEMLAGETLAHTVEFVPFNGEDHASSPGEVVYLAAYPDLSDVRLMVNVDDTGLLGGPSACSTYGLDDETAAIIERCMARADAVETGPQWPASDHMIFAMRGVPAVALIARDVDTVMGEITHTPADTPDKVDADVLGDTARFIADVLRSL
jgi:aminopeptidase YwaD